MPIANYIAEVVSNEEVSGKVLRTVFKTITPEEIDIKAGQYVSIRVADKARRSYSTSGMPGKVRDLETYVDISPQGPGSKFFEGLKVGDRFNFLGPLGNFVFREAAPEVPAVFLATGTGITPFISMFEEFLSKSSRPFVLYWGLRFEADVFALERLDKLAKAYPHFKYVITLSQPQNTWQGEKGYCTDLLWREWDTIRGIDMAHFYLCGAGAMLDSAKAELVERGVPLDQIFYEKFY